MWINIFFSVTFILGLLYLIRYRLNLKYSAEKAANALFPTSEEEMNQILIPSEFMEMQPLTKGTRSYKLVKWGTVGVICLFAVLMMVVFWTDMLHQSIFSIVYLFFFLISSIKHRGNFYIVAGGLILNGYYFAWDRVKGYELEKIIKWHELYGLDDKINHGYKLAVKVDNKWFQPQFVVVRDQVHLDRILSLLNIHGVKKVGENSETPVSSYTGVE
ncbi:hypothetical protein LS684_22100 (plasmid) [Cytobacillus spongiae]|uniref:hypothetical protein n=1 Tax=Cytobacillus spongiae TaxID=2901381 RepID=UPI001F289A6D|nr:hypothetical protein [Cytobacillus spongiae]UII58304.1 hypothetical protein LS684_22100 [Cytobacillus spongiae]